MINLQLTHLRFDCTAVSPIKLGGHYAGSNLRNALSNVMRRAVCDETRRHGDPSPEHTAVCPACYLFSSNLDPGTIVRAYAIVPPLPALHDVKQEERFSFGLTLFGDGFRFLPYFVLAVTEMGLTEGVGAGRRDGNGRFHVEKITAVDPLRGDAQTLLTPDDNLVKIPTVHVDETAVSHITQQHQKNLSANGRFAINFLTPMRLEEKKQLFKMPDFSVLFRRTLYRIDELNRQFADGERRDPAQIAHLNALAEKVRLVETNGRWHELWSHSGRKGRKTPLGGFVGTAVYHADDWSELLPWLIWGQAVQSGKSTAKGNGVFELHGGDWPLYWDWMRSEFDSVR